MDQSDAEDARIVLETGCNIKNKLKLCNDIMEIGRENKMKGTSKEQYQHLGNGTAIIIRRGMKYQHTK